MKRRLFMWGFLIFLGLGVLSGASCFGAEDENAVVVGNVPELLDALGPDRVIELKAGVYNLSENVLQGKASPYYEWKKLKNEYQLELHNLKNIKFIGLGEEARAGDVQILVKPRSVGVLMFDQCGQVTIENIAAGHTPAVKNQLEYQGGVFGFRNCEDVTIEKSELFGGGTEGLYLENVKNLVFRNSVIRECTDGITVARSSRIGFENAEFRDNRDANLIQILNSSEVSFAGCVIRDNQTDEDSGCALFEILRSTGVRVENTAIMDNQMDYFCYGNRFETTNLKLSGNSFEAEDGAFFSEGIPVLAKEELIQKFPFTAFERAKWGMSMDQIKKKARGKLISEDRNHVVFEDKVLDIDCTVAYFNTFGLGQEYGLGMGMDRIFYWIPNREEIMGDHQFKDYYRIRDFLIRTYGQPMVIQSITDAFPMEIWADRKAELAITMNIKDGLSVFVVDLQYYPKDRPLDLIYKD